MNFRETLVDSSRKLADIVVNEVGNNQNKFNALADVMMEDEYPVSMRAARALSLCTEKYPQLILPLLDDMLRKMENMKTEGVKRAVLKILASRKIELNEDQEGILFDRCVHYMNSSSEAIAIKVYSMDIACHISNSYPELKPELRTIFNAMLDDERAGIRARARKMLKTINNV
jgi:hypothetical protein